MSDSQHASIAAVPSIPVVPTIAAWRRDPEPLSYSAFTNLEACSRRWAYGRAEAASDAYFAPRGRLLGRTSLGSIRGNAAHKALQDLLGLYVDHAGPSPDTYDIVEFWEEHLGEAGLPGVVRNALAAEFAVARGNPRNGPLLPHFERQLPRLVEEIVGFVHERLPAVLRVAYAGRAASSGGSRSIRADRHPLGLGSHAEVSVEASLSDGTRTVRWKGQIDVVCIQSGEVTLVDYKTGAVDESHRVQLETYALLFARDGVVNPEGRRATRLVVAYRAGGSTTWDAPNPAQLETIERELTQRSVELLPKLQTETPVATPGAEVCGFCPYRPLCDAYWTQRHPAAVSDAEGLPRGGEMVDVEIEVTLRSPNGDRLEGAVRPRPGVPGGEPRRFLVHESLRPLVRLLDPAQRPRLRVIASRLVPTPPTGHDGKTPLFELGWFSELVVLNKIDQR